MSTRHLQFESLETRAMLALVVPAFSSLPGAAVTLFADFNGHDEAEWGSYRNVHTPAYDTDGNTSSFSASELQAIAEIFARMAEDFAPFNINVTTIEPPSFADGVAARIVFGGRWSNWLGVPAGGVAYFGGFSNENPNTAYVFNTAPKSAAEAGSHEAGHLFSLWHQATWSGSTLVTPYNRGNSAWAPIMGLGYYSLRTTWHNGPTDAAPNDFQDDMAILAGPINGFGYRPDDYGSTVATAAALPAVGTSVNVAGLIGRNDDKDLFSFTTTGGSVSFSLAVAQYGANLDSVLDLLNASGQVIASANPSTSLGASLTTSLASGTYYVSVHSSGGYGNVGQYTLTGTVPQQPQPSFAKIIDDGASGFSTSGTWQRRTGLGRDGDIRTAEKGSGSRVATWTFDGLAAGTYRVSITWPAGNYATNAPFKLFNGSTLTSTTLVNQRIGPVGFADSGSTWQTIGTVTVTGGRLVVKLSNLADGRVVADAVRIERT